MSLLTIILASLAALEHLYIFYLESIRTTSDTTSRVFNMDKEELARPSVTSLFKNQGIYNALIGAFLLYGLFVSKNSRSCYDFCALYYWGCYLRCDDSQ